MRSEPEDRVPDPQIIEEKSEWIEHLGEVEYGWLKQIDIIGDN